ncbi:hypothetical protein IWX90DRAFT_107317 [Phyllosticta citrichinensis]|uniref:Uncharacterized protein n=1 Tax=Phyllosticta citrichinensis TaxID=1130410 RepID=A0ABR1Y2C7_9PEZI
MCEPARARGASKITSGSLTWPGVATTQRPSAAAPACPQWPLRLGRSRFANGGALAEGQLWAKVTWVAGTIIEANVFVGFLRGPLVAAVADPAGNAQPLTLALWLVFCGTRTTRTALEIGSRAFATIAPVLVRWRNSRRDLESAAIGCGLRCNESGLVGNEWLARPHQGHENFTSQAKKTKLEIQYQSLLPAHSMPIVPQHSQEMVTISSAAGNKE